MKVDFQTQIGTPRQYRNQDNDRHIYIIKKIIIKLVMEFVPACITVGER
jgi:hypothetical protein